MKQGTTGSATVHMDAAPDVVYDLVTDITRMGEWSPECRKCVWLDGRSGPAVGARFRGTNGRGIIRWSTTSTVEAAEPGQEFSFATAITRWSYRFEPDGDGTRVTESFEMIADEPWLPEFGQRYLLRIKDRAADLEVGMRATLERIKAVVERGGPAG